MQTELSLPVLILLLTALGGLTILFISSTVKAIITRRGGWLALAILSGPLATGLLGYLCLQIAEPSPEVMKPGPDTRIFRSKDAISEISVPSSWSETPMGPEDASLRVGDLSKSEFLTIISEPKSDFDDGFTLRNYAATANLLIVDGLSETAQTELDDFQLNGMNALRNQISGTKDDAHIAYILTYVEGKDHFHQIRCWSPAGTRGDSFPRLKKATDSFYELN